MSDLRLSRVTVGYRDGRKRRAVLREVDVVARRGELTALIGPNGTGKSTLLRTIAGLQPSFAGSIRLDGQHLDRLSAAERARHQAVVLTERVAPGRLTAREMVGLGRHPHTGFLGRLTPHDDELVEEALRAVGAGPLADRDISELSDGERQRVMTARALAQQPRLLLMDEPSAFLDAPGRVALAGLLRRIAVEQDVVAIVSTHEVELALQVADRIWLLDRDGLVHSGTPEELVVSGLLGRVFDSADLVFDPVAGLFTLVGQETGAVRVCGPAGPDLLRLLKRRGWRRDDEGPAALELRPLGSAQWELVAGGEASLVDGFAALAERLSVAPPTRGLARVGPEAVRRAAAEAARFGAYFEVGEDRAGMPLGEVEGEWLQAWTQTTCDRLGSKEPRVGASTLQFGFAARCWSLVVGCWARRGIVPDLGGLSVLDGEDRPSLTWTPGGGWLDEGAAPELVARLMAEQVQAATDPLHARLRAQVRLAAGLLDGNRAAAAVGALRALRRHRAELVHDVEPLLAAILTTPIVADHHDPQQLATDGLLPQRRSCCLYYRSARGGTCGDCPVTPRPRDPRTADTA